MDQRFAMLHEDDGWYHQLGYVTCIFYIKNKLKPEIFNDKNVYKQKYFSVWIKNKGLMRLNIND